jgi:hypothetical protein
MVPTGADGCRWFVGTLEDMKDLTVNIMPCTTEIFPHQHCKVIKNDLTLAFFQNFPDLGKPQMTQSLDILGLSKVVQVDGDLNIINFGTSTSQGLPLGDMQFFPDLRRVHRLNLRDNNVKLGQQPMFSSMSGFKNLEEVDVLQISNQGFSNLSSFVGLKCVATGIAVLNNPRLVTLAGLLALELVGYDVSPGSKIIITGNPMLDDGSAFAALGRAAHCPGYSGIYPADPITVTVRSCTTPLLSWAMLCDFLADTTCPPQSQPPALPPSRPSPSQAPNPPSPCPLPPVTQNLAPGEHTLTVHTSKSNESMFTNRSTLGFRPGICGIAIVYVCKIGSRFVADYMMYVAA